MKRLIRKANMNLMHGTSSTFYKDIKENGLKGSGTTDNSVTRNNNGWGSGALSSTSVYLTDDEDVALNYASRAVDSYGGEPIIVHVNIDEGDLGPDDDVNYMLETYQEDDEDDYYSKYNPDEISGIDSLEIMHAAVYYGDITPNQITSIEWFNGDSPPDLLEKADDKLTALKDDIKFNVENIRDNEVDYTSSRLVEDYNDIIDKLNKILESTADLTISHDATSFMYRGQSYAPSVFIDKLDEIKDNLENELLG